MYIYMLSLYIYIIIIYIYKQYVYMYRPTHRLYDRPSSRPVIVICLDHQQPHRRLGRPLLRLARGIIAACGASVILCHCPWENHGKTMGKPWENHGKTHIFWGSTHNFGCVWANNCHFKQEYIGIQSRTGVEPRNRKHMADFSQES